jgi:hypothetical protein
MKAVPDRDSFTIDKLNARHLFQLDQGMRTLSRSRGYVLLLAQQQVQALSMETRTSR